MAKEPYALIIIDGFGLREESRGNAVQAAHKPNFDRYWQEFSHQELRADGLHVGLPEGQMGNSEVGHMNIGAGRIVYQSLTRINKSIQEGDFYEIPELQAAIRHVQDRGTALHLMGLLSDGGVHSHYNHLFTLLKLAKEAGLDHVYVHGFLDGRDVGPATGLGFVQDTEKVFQELGLGRFASLSGRYYAMDRDRRWDRIQLAYEAIVRGQSDLTFAQAEAGVQASYDAGVYDEFVRPFVITEGGQPVACLEDGDAVIFFNFRPDRAIQLSTAITQPDFQGFDRGKFLDDVYFASFTKYSDDVVAEVVFKKQDLANTLGEALAQAGKRQIRIAETEKFPHVTFFMSGGRHEEFPGEDRILIPSPKVATYDLQPEMSAYEVKEALLAKLREGQTDVIILNFANPDMVGHSGMLEPTVQAIEAVDECLGEIVDLILEMGGLAIITADHGNADEVIDLEGKPMTAHTTNPVPVIVTEKGVSLRSGGILADLAPTLLDMMGLAQPEEMTGKSLIIRSQAHTKH